MRAERPAPVEASGRPADAVFRRRWTRWTRQRTAVLGWLIALVLRLLYLTFRVRCIDSADALGAMRRGERPVVAFWHDGLLLLPALKLRVYREAAVTAMLSWHTDAEIAAQALGRLGIRAARGSSTRGWLGGLRGLLAAHRAGQILAVVPDGPRGPRHQAKDGVVMLARATGTRLIAIGTAARPARRLASWDRMQVPAPFARVALVLQPVAMPAREAGAAAGRAAVEAALTEVNAIAARAVGA